MCQNLFIIRLFYKIVQVRRRGRKMYGMLVEMACPQHGLERFTIKVVKRFNIPPNDIVPRFRVKPKPDLSCLVVGRNVKDKEVQAYLETYLQQKGMWERVISFRSV
jgi:hypothetical protein